MKAYPETHQQGLITIESIPDEVYHRYVRGNYNPASLTGDFGIQIAEDGRVWVCINGVAVMRFKPLPTTTPQEGGEDHERRQRTGTKALESSVEVL